MKILLIHNFYQIKGGEDIGAEQTKLLFEKKKDHNIITYFLDNKEIENFSLWQKSLLLIKTIFSLKSYKEISALIKIEKPDLAHIHNVFPPLVLKLASDIKINIPKKELYDIFA